MRIRSKAFIATALAIGLTISSLSICIAAESEDEICTNTLLPAIEKSDITIENGTVYDLTNETGSEVVFDMTDTTIVIKYESTGNQEYQSLFSVSNGTTGNQDRHFHLYITPNGTLGMELRNTDDDFKYTMSAVGAVNPEKENIIAFKADSATGEYKLFANGKKVQTLEKEVFKGFEDITGADTISLGGTIRQGNVGYPFAGEISDFKIYNNCMSDEDLICVTDNTPDIPSGLLFEKSDVQINEGTIEDVSEEENADYMEFLEEGTIVLSYTTTSTNSIQSLFSIGNNSVGNQDRHFHLYITSSGGLGMELRNTDSEFKYTMSRPASVVEKEHGENVINTIAFKADKENKQYKLFANGELLVTLNVDDYKFICDIMGVNNVGLGGVNRQGTVAYPFGGTIYEVKVYGSPLSDEELISTTGVTKYGTNIFYAGDATNSNYFRIPALLTLESDTVVAAADARYGGTHDAKSNIDIAFSKSTDGGQTWSQATLPLCFDDYVAKQIEWPRDSVGRNVQIQGSATFIDPVLLEDTITDRLFLFADAMPAGIGVSNASYGSGYKTIDGNRYMKLRWYEDGSNTYNYSIRENGIIYNDVTGEPTEYKVDGQYNLLKNNQLQTCKQYDYYFEGTTLKEVKTDVDVNMNVFYKDAVFKVYPTTYLAMKYSDDEGQTWSDLKILSSFKPETEKFLVVGPGVGKQISVGENAGRLIVPLYSNVNVELGFMYSDDHGDTWNYVAADDGGTGATAEAQIVEMPDGSLKTYMRTSSGTIAEVTSIDGGVTWTDRKTVPGMTAASYGTQVSAINYSGMIDGKPAIVLAAPSATNGRRNGIIHIGLINDTGKEGTEKYEIEWKYSYAVDGPQIGYSYSCLTELPNGNIGLLYEKYDSWSRDELHLKNVLKYDEFTVEELIENQ